MSLVAVFVAAAVAGQPAPPSDPGVAAAQPPIRCRPAPYMVADTEAEPKVERRLITGSHVPIRISEKRARPCYLTKEGRLVERDSA